MSERPANAIDSIRSMTATRRFLVLSAAAVALVGIWMVGRWATAPTFVPLYRDLALGEVGTIGAALDKAEIQHRLGAGGTEVLVPAADLARARVALARDGLAQAGRPGLELFDKPSWGMTDFTQRVTYQRALEGELANGAEVGFPGVDEAVAGWLGALGFEGAAGTAGQKERREEGAGGRVAAGIIGPSGPLVRRLEGHRAS